VEGRCRRRRLLIKPISSERTDSHPRQASVSYRRDHDRGLPSPNQRPARFPGGPGFLAGPGSSSRGNGKAPSQTLMAEGVARR